MTTLELHDLKYEVDKKLADLFLDDSPLNQAARYALEGGKRLRPLLLLSTLASFSDDWTKGLVPACALEMVHTYSLIHDDLPCMDDDDQRRGRPSLHRAFPEWQAVLTGDFLLTYAFELLADFPELIAPIAKASGGLGMVGGQMLDLQHKGRPLTWDLRKELYTKKTGALIAVSVKTGTLLAKEQNSALDELGDLLGFGYQLADDLKDGDSTLDHRSTQKALEEIKERIKALFSILPVLLLENLATKML